MEGWLEFHNKAAGRDIRFLFSCWQKWTGMNGLFEYRCLELHVLQDLILNWTLDGLSYCPKWPNFMMIFMMIFSNFLTYFGPSNLEAPVHSIWTDKYYSKFGPFYWVWNKELMFLRFCKEVMHSRVGSWRVMFWPERVLEGPGGSRHI